MKFQDLCAPAQLYFVLAVISTLVAFYYGTRLRSVFLSIVFMLFWVWLLNKLCQWGLHILAWIIVLFPFIVILIIMLVFYIYGKKEDKKDDKKEDK